MSWWVPCRAAATEGRRDPDPHSSSRDRDRDWRGRDRDSDRHGYRRRSSRSRSRSRSRERDRDRRGAQQQQPPRPGSLGGATGGGGPSGAVSSASGGAKVGLVGQAATGVNLWVMSWCRKTKETGRRTRNARLPFWQGAPCSMPPHGRRPWGLRCPMTLRRGFAISNRKQLCCHYDSSGRSCPDPSVAPPRPAPAYGLLGLCVHRSQAVRSGSPTFGSLLPAEAKPALVISRYSAGSAPLKPLFSALARDVLGLLPSLSIWRGWAWPVDYRGQPNDGRLAPRTSALPDLPAWTPIHDSVLQAGAGAAAAAKETPQERLKRIMAAQLNKQAQKDNLATAQKKLQVGHGGVGGWWSRQRMRAPARRFLDGGGKAMAGTRKPTRSR